MPSKKISGTPEQTAAGSSVLKAIRRLSAPDPIQLLISHIENNNKEGFKGIISNIDVDALNKINGINETILHHITQKINAGVCDIEIFKIALKASKKPVELLSKKDENGSTILKLALQNGLFEILTVIKDVDIRLFNERGITSKDFGRDEDMDLEKPNTIDPKPLSTRLVRDILFVNMILEGGSLATPGLKTKGGQNSEDGANALHLAIKHGLKIEVLQALIDKGVSVDSVDNQGRTALYLAAQIARKNDDLSVLGVLTKNKDFDPNITKDGKMFLDLLTMEQRERLEKGEVENWEEKESHNRKSSSILPPPSDENSILEDRETSINPDNRDFDSEFKHGRESISRNSLSSIPPAPPELEAPSRPAPKRDQKINIETENRRRSSSVLPPPPIEEENIRKAPAKPAPTKQEAIDRAARKVELLGKAPEKLAPKKVEPEISKEIKPGRMDLAKKAEFLKKPPVKAPPVINKETKSDALLSKKELLEKAPTKEAPKRDKNSAQDPSAILAPQGVSKVVFDKPKER